MTNELFSIHRQLNSIGNYLDEESLFQSEYHYKKEEINNNSILLKKSSDLLLNPSNVSSVHSPSFFSKDDIWRKMFITKKLDDYNEDEIKTKKTDFFPFSVDNTSYKTGKSKKDNLDFLLNIKCNFKTNSNQEKINDISFLLNNKKTKNVPFSINKITPLIEKEKKINNEIISDNKSLKTKEIKFIKETLGEKSLDTEEKKSKKENININNGNNTNNISNNNNDIKPKLILRKRRPRKSNINLQKLNLNFEDKCFPFKSGKGIINITTKYQKDFIGPVNNDNNHLDINKNNVDNVDDNDSNNDNDIFSYNSEEDEEKKERILNLNLNLKGQKTTLTPVENELYLMKFATEKYYYGENGKKKKIKKKRKDKADIIRKKIKSRFHKELKIIINNNLKYAESKLEFEYLPQCFIGNVSKVFNCKYFDFTYKEILLSDFGSELIQYRHTSKDYSKYLKNVKVLKYLENNPEISKKSGFDLIKDLKYKDLLHKYLLSLEFEDSINKLKKENESEEYIQLYIIIAKNYINYYYNNFHFLNKDNNNNGMEIKEDDHDEDNEDNNCEKI